MHGDLDRGHQHGNVRDSEIHKLRGTTPEEGTPETAPPRGKQQPLIVTMAHAIARDAFWDQAQEQEANIGGTTGRRPTACSTVR